MGLCERFSFLALQKIFISHPRIADKLISEAGNALELFQGNRKRFIHLFDNNMHLWKKFREFDDWDPVERMSLAMEKSGISMFTRYDARYPEFLKTIPDPPLLIMTKGKGVDLLNYPCVGIVGARKATRDAVDMAANLAEYLSDKGYCIVSGLAYGIDSAAHNGALSGSGETIAVFGCGLHTVYPACNRGIADRITEKGLLLSEFLPGTDPFPNHFPQRNRIISGMSMAVIVVQAARASGSLITARFALEQGREVLAVPGQGGHRSFMGSNALIRDGAVLVESGEEIFEILERERTKWPFLKNPGHLADYMDNGSPLLNFFPKRGGVSFDSLASKSGWDVKEILKEITKLSIEGSIEEMPGRRYRLKKDNDGIISRNS